MEPGPWLYTRVWCWAGIEAGTARAAALAEANSIAASKGLKGYSKGNLDAFLDAVKATPAAADPRRHTVVQTVTEEEVAGLKKEGNKYMLAGMEIPLAFIKPSKGPGHPPTLIFPTHTLLVKELAVSRVKEVHHGAVGPHSGYMTRDGYTRDLDTIVMGLGVDTN